MEIGADEVIAIRGLSFAYPRGDFRLDIPHLALGAGEKVAVVGPSGAGKTTLLNLVAGICVPDSGTVRLADAVVSGLGDAARRALRAAEVGFVFQDFALLDYLSARENILYPCRIATGRRPDAELRDRAERLGQACGLAGLLDRHPGALSRGEQQRVALCRALIRRPRLILADEATGNLDPDNKGAILDLLFEQVSRHGATLLAVTHDHELLPRFDRVIDFSGFRRAGRAA